MPAYRAAPPLAAARTCSAQAAEIADCPRGRVTIKAPVRGDGLLGRNEAEDAVRPAFKTCGAYSKDKYKDHCEEIDGVSIPLFPELTPEPYEQNGRTASRFGTMPASISRARDATDNIYRIYTRLVRRHSLSEQSICWPGTLGP